MMTRKLMGGNFWAGGDRYRRRFLCGRIKIWEGIFGRAAADIRGVFQHQFQRGGGPISGAIFDLIGSKNGANLWQRVLRQ